MIKSTLDNLNDILSKETNELVKKGLGWLKSTDFNNLKDGKHIINDNMFVNIQTYLTKMNADFEAHRKYIDIQYIISGSEYIGVCDYKNCTTTIPYDSVNDIEFLTGYGENHIMDKDDFMILYPNDAHKPSIAIDNPKEVRKAVIKVLYNPQ